MEGQNLARPILLITIICGENLVDLVTLEGRSNQVEQQ